MNRSADNVSCQLYHLPVFYGEETWYASYVKGDASAYTNADGKSVDLYPAQFYVLLYGCADGDSAGKALADWSERAADGCTAVSEETVSANGMNYDLKSFRIDKEQNEYPYARKVSAFARYGRYAVVIELTCTDDYTGNAEADMTDFLDHCHYDGSQREE